MGPWSGRFLWYVSPARQSIKYCGKHGNPPGPRPPDHQLLQRQLRYVDAPLGPRKRTARKRLRARGGGGLSICGDDITMHYDGGDAEKVDLAQLRCHIPEISPASANAGKSANSKLDTFNKFASAASNVRNIVDFFL